MNDKYVGIIFFVAFMHARIIIQLNNITGPSDDGRYGHRGNKANHIFFLFVFLHFLTVCTEQWLFLLFAFFVRLLCRRIKSCVSVALFLGTVNARSGWYMVLRVSTILMCYPELVIVWIEEAPRVIRKPIVSIFFFSRSLVLIFCFYSRLSGHMRVCDLQQTLKCGAIR